MKDVFKALAHPVRRRIMEILRAGAAPAGDIASHFDVSAPTMSGHLKVLREAGLIEAERDGTTIRYRLNASVAAEAAGAILDLLNVKAAEAQTTGEEGSDLAPQPPNQEQDTP